jgi:hypothetical protein
MWKQRATSAVREVVDDFIEAEQMIGIDHVGVWWSLGLDGYMALDLDGFEPEWWAELPETAVNETRRGRHLIYRQPSGHTIGNGDSKFPTKGWGEVRGAGGYVVVWWPGDRPGFDVAELERVVEFPRPDWLTDAGDERPGVSPAALQAFKSEHTAGDGSGINGFRTKLEARPFGSSRNKWATDVACWIAREAAAGLVPAAEAFAALEQWWVSVSGPEMGEDGVLKTRKLTMREIVRIECWAIGQLTPERIAGMAPSSERDDELLLELIDWSVVHDPADDLIEGYLMPGRWTQNVVGAKGGKSTWTMWLATELSEGRDPIDGTPVVPVTVLYCDAEMGRRDLESLIRDMGHDPVALVNLHCSDFRPRLDTTLGAGLLLGRVDQLGARAVVLDGLNGFIDPEATENTDPPWRQIFERTVQPLKARGVAVLSNDNMGKDPAKGSRGNSAKNDKADGVVYLKKTDQGLQLTTTFQRAGAYFDTLHLNAEGFDRSKRIRYWRGLGGVPAGTLDAARLLDRLSVPTELGRNRVRVLLRAANESVSNEVLAAAIRYRHDPLRPVRDRPDR